MVKWNTYDLMMKKHIKCVTSFTQTRKIMLFDIFEFTKQKKEKNVFQKIYKSRIKYEYSFCAFIH